VEAKRVPSRFITVYSRSPTAQKWRRARLCKESILLKVTHSSKNLVKGRTRVYQSRKDVYNNCYGVVFQIWIFWP
jgi:hypothetical protein